MGKQIKKHKLFKTVSVISTMLVLLTACGMNSSKPDYLLEGARDNGFIAAYRAYYAIKDETVKKISKRKYERYVYKDKDYTSLKTTYNSMNAKAVSEDISMWEFDQNKYNDSVYDKQTLIDRLSEMEIDYTGKVYILITEFDEYQIFEVKSLDDEDVILDTKYAVFHNDSMLATEGNPDLSSIRSVRKYNR